MSLPIDGQERSEYLHILDRIDSMVQIWQSHTFLQLPILLLIVGNLMGLLSRTSAFYPFTRAMQRAIPDLAVLTVVIAFLTWGFAFIALMILGDHIEHLNTFNKAQTELFEYALADEGNFIREAIMPAGVLNDALTDVVVGLFYAAYPFYMWYILIQFFMAIIVDYYVQEQEQKRKSSEFREANLSDGELLFRKVTASPTSQYGPYLQIVISILKALDLKWIGVALLKDKGSNFLKRCLRMQAYITKTQAVERTFSVWPPGDKASHGGKVPRKSTAFESRFFEENVLTGLMASKTLMDRETRGVHSAVEHTNAKNAMEQKRKQIWSGIHHAIRMKRNVLTKGSASAQERQDARHEIVELQRALARLVNAANRAEDLSDGVIDRKTAATLDLSREHKLEEMSDEQLLAQGARWLRMNHAHYRSINLPIVGTVGVIATGEMIHDLHMRCLKDIRTMQTRAGWAAGFTAAPSNSLKAPKSDLASIASMKLSDASTSTPFKRAKSGRVDALAQMKQARALPKLDYSLFNFVPQSEYEHVFGSDHHHKLTRYRSFGQDRHLKKDEVQSMLNGMNDEEIKNAQMNACKVVARRILGDIGVRGGSEFDLYRGLPLVQLSLKRGYDTTRGMASITLDMMQALGAVVDLSTIALGAKHQESFAGSPTSEDVVGDPLMMMKKS